MSMTAVIHEHPSVPQPRQHGGAGGFLRHTNIFTGAITGVLLSTATYMIGSRLVPWGTQDATFQQVGLNALIGATFVAWVVGFMAGIGAFAGPIRWMLGHDLTHDDSEYMAGKGQGHMKYWKYTTDHKVVGIQYLVMALVLFGFGGFFAMLIRTELGVTWSEVFDPNFYNSIIGTHGIVMIVAMIIVVAGPLGNFIMPLMIGARDMAFPRLNALSFWLLFAAVPPLLANLLLGGIRDGWTVYQPLGTQAPIGMIGYQVCIITFAFSTGIAGVNLITTIVTMRARGMTWNRVPIFVVGILAAAIMGLIWFPMFQYSQIMAMSDRVISTSFFTPHAGGSVWLYENLFWLLGHPEVYVIVIPVTAAMLELMTVFLRKPLFSYKLAIAGFAGVVAISAVVWVHHMYMTGFAPAAGYPFMLSTELISIPFGFLVLVMLGTMWRGKVWTRLPMMAVYAMIWCKIIGGITGVYLSDVPVDQFMHGSMFVVAHFHYMLMGAGLFGAMGAIAYWFPKMTGRMFDERIGSIGFWTAFLAFQVTFMSMFVSGLQGMPRRVLQFDNAFNIANWISTIGAYFIGIGMLIFLYAIFTSWRSGKAAPSNPWGAKTLDWQTQTPVPLANFPVLPVVTGDPYDYGVPDPYLAVDAELAKDDNESVGAR
ncbi:MAG: cbb3-type cytochrome c oxidase subunit I [Actinomycetota bacterium]|nr:cbb3-type cytochrome c oxidase subunit I [Actinomycetota bacterium]